MKLPNRKNARIKRSKITNYLLSLTHPVGKSKAVFFRGIGFDETNTTQLKRKLREIAQTNDVKNPRPNKWGVNYEIIGALKAPNGKTYPIRTFWFIKAGTKNPSFKSAYPV